MDAQRYHVQLDSRGKSNVSLREGLKKALNKGEVKHPYTLSSLEMPVFLMNYPLSVDNEVKNNVLMNKGNKPYNHTKAFAQFMELYRLIVAGGAFVHNLPSTVPPSLQDLPFVANVGCYLPHVKPDTMLIANFKSPPRKGEDKIAEDEFKKMNYAIAKPPTHWEGEADLKYIKDNLWIGGYGIRTDQKSFNWMADKFDMDIITVKMDDPKLYHFDCQFFPVSEDKALVSTSAFRPEDLKKVEKHLGITEVPKEFKYEGWTNSLRLGDKVLWDKSPNPNNPSINKASVKAHDATIEKLGYEPINIELSEFAKSGGDLSCLILHINYKNRE